VSVPEFGNSGTDTNLAVDMPYPRGYTHYKQPRAILLLEIKEGDCPFEKWYRSLRDRRARIVVFAKVTRLSEPAFSGFKPAGGGVFELRVFFGPGYRIYFGIRDERSVVLLGGGDKSSQREDITEARQLWKRYKNETQRYKRKLAI
jgi:putative addiction module killer protein